MTTVEGARARLILGACVTLIREWAVPGAQGDLGARVGLNVPGSDIRYIFMLANRNELMTPGDIAKHFGLTRPTVSKAIAELREAGLIRNEPSPDDRRSVYVTLTDEGFAAYRRITLAAMGLIHHVAEDFTDAEMDAITRFFDTLAHKIGTDGPVIVPAQFEDPSAP